MDETQKRIMDFIRQQKFIDNDAGDLEQLKLFHLGISKESLLWGGKVGHEGDPEELAAEAWACASDDAEGYGGVQRYALRSYHGKKKNHSAICRFRVASSEETGEGLSWHDDSEPTNLKGAFGQQMRHNEAMMRISTAATGVVLKRYEVMLNRAHARIETLEKAHDDLIMAREELLSMQHERDLETLKMTNREKRMDEGLQTIKLLGPPLVNRIAGKKLLPEESTSEGQLMANFMDSLDENQMEKLSKVLKPAQLAFVMQLVNEHQDNKAKKNAAE